MTATYEPDTPLSDVELAAVHRFGVDVPEPDWDLWRKQRVEDELAWGGDL